MQTQTTTRNPLNAKRLCTRCNQRLPRTEFGKKNKWCRTCAAEYTLQCQEKQKNRASKPKTTGKREWSEERRREAADRRYQKEYRVTLADIEALSASQNDLCAICGGPQQAGYSRLSVSWYAGPEPGQKTVHALVCSLCSALKTALPHMDANPELIGKTRAYLQTLSEIPIPAFPSQT